MLWRCDWGRDMFVNRLLKQIHNKALMKGETWWVPRFRQLMLRRFPMERVIEVTYAIGGHQRVIGKGRIV